MNEKRIGRKSIYPLSDDNFVALLNHFLPKYPQGTISNFLPRFKDIGITTKDIEICLHQITPYLEELEFHSKSSLSKFSICQYAIDIYLEPTWKIGFLSAHKVTVKTMKEIVFQK